MENTQSRLFRKLGTHSHGGTLSVAHSLGLIESPGDPAQLSTISPPQLPGDGAMPPGPGRAALEPDGYEISIPFPSGGPGSEADGTRPARRFIQVEI